MALLQKPEDDAAEQPAHVGKPEHGLEAFDSGKVSGVFFLYGFKVFLWL